MHNIKGKYIEIIIHAFCWIAITYLFIHYNALSFHYLKGDIMDVPLLFGTFINILLFYANLFLLFPQYSLKRINLLQLAIWLFILTIVLSVIENSFDYYYAANHFYDEKILLQSEEIIVTSFVNLFFVLLSVLYAIVRAWVKNEIVVRKLTEENLKLELNFLKSQISPHFLFNSLNNLYSIAIKNDDNETATGLSKLSTLMRFMLDKSNKTTVKLSEEVQYLESYIELQKLRFLDDDDLTVSFKTKGDAEGFSLPPFLLINFVENAFNHGIDYKLPSVININLNVDENTMAFTIENSNHALKKTKEHTGIGLENVKKRLELLYGGNYGLKIKSNSQKYFVELEIKNLNKK